MAAGHPALQAPTQTAARCSYRHAPRIMTATVLAVRPLVGSPLAKLVGGQAVKSGRMGQRHRTQLVYELRLAVRLFPDGYRMLLIRPSSPHLMSGLFCTKAEQTLLQGMTGTIPGIHRHAERSAQPRAPPGPRAHEQQSSQQVQQAGGQHPAQHRAASTLSQHRHAQTERHHLPNQRDSPIGSSQPRYRAAAQLSSDELSVRSLSLAPPPAPRPSNDTHPPDASRGCAASPSPGNAAEL